MISVHIGDHRLFPSQLMLFTIRSQKTAVTKNYLATSLLHCHTGSVIVIVTNVIESWGAGIVICLELGASDLHMVQLMPLPPHHLLVH